MTNEPTPITPPTLLQKLIAVGPLFRHCVFNDQMDPSVVDPEMAIALTGSAILNARREARSPAENDQITEWLQAIDRIIDAHVVVTPKVKVLT